MKVYRINSSVKKYIFFPVWVSDFSATVANDLHQIFPGQGILSIRTKWIIFFYKSSDFLPKLTYGSSSNVFIDLH